MEDKELEKRNQKIYARYKAGQSKAKIARVFKLSRQRVGIIIKKIEVELSMMPEYPVEKLEVK